MTDANELFERTTSKRQKNMKLSRELCGVLKEVCEPFGQSQFVEDAVWKALIEEHGEEAIKENISDVQAGIDSFHTLPDDREPESYTIEV